jgi:hypothetical protein
MVQFLPCSLLCEYACHAIPRRCRAALSQALSVEERFHHDFDGSISPSGGRSPSPTDPSEVRYKYP